MFAIDCSFRALVSVEMCCVSGSRSHSAVTRLSSCSARTSPWNRFVAGNLPMRSSTSWCCLGNTRSTRNESLSYLCVFTLLVCGLVLWQLGMFFG
eukprot:3967568-Amphidinium_carterae.1